MATKTRITPEQVAALQELDRRECEADAAVFTERHCTIEDPDGTVRPFALWPFQADTLRDLQAGEQIIVLKARRLGLSWVVLAFALWLAIHRQGIRILILCKTGDDAGELLDRIRRMRDRIAADPLSAHILANLQAPAKTRDAVTTLDIGGSTIRALMGTPAAARSETAGFLILDEFAFQRGAADIWQAVLPTVEGGGGLAVVSTGNGAETSGKIGAQYAMLWSRARAGDSTLKALFFPWMVRPDRNQEWKDRTVALLGDLDQFKVEYPEIEDDAFLAPGVQHVYPPAGVDAAEARGRILDQQLADCTIAPPYGSAIQVGIDWGEQTHALIIWPLEAGGIYVAPAEVVASSMEPTATSQLILDAAARIDWPLDEERFDAAGVQSNRTFAAVAPRSVRWKAIPFNRFKTETVGYLRLLFNRVADGHDTKIIAISPRNEVLLRQLRGLLLADDDSGKVAKGNDHGPDALIAGAAPIAAAHRALTVTEG